MIRAAERRDTDALLEIAEASTLFTPEELVEVGGMLSAHFDGELGDEHFWITDDEDGPAAVAYYAPEPFSSGVWNLYMLAVHPDRQGGGRGAAIIRYVENDVRARGARILIIETSGLPRFERTRKFYEKCGFDLEARVRDYYAAGDDKIVFWKSMTRQ